MMSFVYFIGGLGESSAVAGASEGFHRARRPIRQAPCGRTASAFGRPSRGNQRGNGELNILFFGWARAYFVHRDPLSLNIKIRGKCRFRNLRRSG